MLWKCNGVTSAVANRYAKGVYGLQTASAEDTCGRYGNLSDDSLSVSAEK